MCYTAAGHVALPTLPAEFEFRKTKHGHIDGVKNNVTLPLMSQEHCPKQIGTAPWYAVAAESRVATTMLHC